MAKREYTPEQLERKREACRKWYAANREQQIEYSRNWRLKNPERAAATQKRTKKIWQAKNPDKCREYAKRWAAKNKPRISEKNRQWDRANVERRRANQRRRNGFPLPTRPCPSLCECCGGPPNGQGSLHLDHCHETGRFRGWLCAKCNAGMGLLGDNEFGLMRAVMYLTKAMPHDET